jgi:hypothetical protein
MRARSFFRLGCILGLALGLGGLLSAGCSSEPDLSNPEEAGEALGEALCGYVSGCCGESAVPGGTEENCVAQISANFDLLIQQAEEGGYQYDPRCVEAYIEALSGDTCSLANANGQPTPGTCKPYCVSLAHGDKQEGEACADPRDCDFGLQCQGTCVDPCGSGVGSPCGQIGENQYAFCSVELFCKIDDFETGAGTCAAFPEKGEPCESFACAAGLACIDGVCDEPLPDGAPCPSYSGCQSNNCDISDPQNPVCAPAPGVGEACTAFCATGLYCSAETLTCATLPGKGDACPDFQCAPGLVCSDDVCIDEADLFCQAFEGD